MQPMIPDASPRTALYAGAWTSFGVSLVEAWTVRHPIDSGLLSTGVWFATFAIFLLIPGYLFVIGSDNPRLDPLWIADPEQRRAGGVIIKRMGLWFVSASICGALWSVVWRSLIA